MTLSGKAAIYAKHLDLTDEESVDVVSDEIQSVMPDEANRTLP